MHFYITHMQQNNTRYTSCKNTRPLNLHGIPSMPEQLQRLAVESANGGHSLQNSWSTFRIPKTSGGYREITAPSEHLKEKQRILLHILKDDFRILESDWAYAYVTGRSTVLANEKHLQNKSCWFLKLDIKDFFPSITADLIHHTIKTQYPTCTFPAIDRIHLLNCIKTFALKDDRAPQGAVTSPFISNWVMTPILYQINKKLKEMAESEDFPQVPKQKYVLTCYADDMVISAKHQFNWMQVRDAVAEILSPYFRLNLPKTKYTWNKGRNHMLGKVLNSEQKATMGFRKAREWKRIFYELCNEMNGHLPERSLQEKTSLLGQLNWDFNTQRGYLEYLLEKYETKFTQDVSIISYLKGVNNGRDN